MHLPPPLGDLAVWAWCMLADGYKTHSETHSKLHTGLETTPDTLATMDQEVAYLIFKDWGLWQLE